MRTVGAILNSSGLFSVLSETAKHCDKHGIDYTEKVYKHFTQGCPECMKEREEKRLADEARDIELKQQEALQKLIAKRIGASGIPKRFQGKTVRGYVLQEGNEQQAYVIQRIKTYAHELATQHNGRSLALLGNAGTGKTHLACALGNHVINNCNGIARFVSVSELNRLVREAKSFDSETTETEVIEAFAAYDLLIIDEVGVQSGTDAESRALFDVFNTRYENYKPTVLISNLDVDGFISAVGERIADRIKEDGGEVLLFNWKSHRA